MPSTLCLPCDQVGSPDGRVLELRSLRREGTLVQRRVLALRPCGSRGFEDLAAGGCEVLPKMYGGSRFDRSQKVGTEGDRVKKMTTTKLDDGLRETVPAGVAPDGSAWMYDCPHGDAVGGFRTRAEAVAAARKHERQYHREAQ
jgi:hypothetical protein